MKNLRNRIRQIRGLMRDSGLLWTASLILSRTGLPVMGLWQEKNVSREKLAAHVSALLRAWGMPEDHLSITVDHLLYADMHGIDSHGCAMLSEYHRGIAAGRLTMNPKIEVVRDSATTALIDGGGGLGFVPADTAMKLAVAKCRKAGVGVSAVRNSGHFGAAGAYTALAAREGFIGIATTTNRIPAVVPTFGIEALLGTNPISVAAPANNNRPFLLDMASSTVSVGKLMTYWRHGRSIPVGWALGPDGKPLRNGSLAAGSRRLTPLGGTREMGGHKGYGLCAVVEILSSVLSGLRSNHAPAEEARVGHFFLALDPDRFRAPGDFEADMDTLMDSLRASRPLDPEQPVIVAGDPEYAAYEERSRQGIPLSRSVVEDLRSLCRASGVPLFIETNESEQFTP